MRVDKYLWCIRLFKTRKLATEACAKNKIWVNSAVVKPSKIVMPGDEIWVKQPQVTFKYTIIAIPNNRVSAKLVSLYLKDITDPLEIEKYREIIAVQNYYRQDGTGRPSGKDREHIEKFLNTLFQEDEE